MTGKYWFRKFAYGLRNSGFIFCYTLNNIFASACFIVDCFTHSTREILKTLKLVETVCLILRISGDQLLLIKYYDYYFINYLK